MDERTPRAPFLVLGMHRSGTSCLAGMLEAAGVAAAGPAVRNWDNARGHFEALALVRLNEAVLATSGGHWLAPAAEVKWTPEQAEERERLLGQSIAGLPALLKDPRSLLCLPFWRASPTLFRVLGIVRHPLAVARSLAAWRAIPLAEGLALWTAHARLLLADQAAHGYPLLDFERTKEEFVAALVAAGRVHGVELDARLLAEAYEERLVHHDTRDGAHEPGLAEAEDLFAVLAQRAGPGTRARARTSYPNEAMQRFERALAARNGVQALAAARSALAHSADAGAIAVPVVAALLRVRALDTAQEFLRSTGPKLEKGLAELLRGKVLLARDDASGAVRALTAACAVPEPYYQARRLLPHALRQAGRHPEAYRLLAELAPDTLHPHGPLSLLGEWAWSDGDRPAACAHMRAAIASAPPHRRGRMRTRLAEWLLATDGHEPARAELRLALEEDPTYLRAREELARLEQSLIGAAPAGQSG